MRAPEGYTVDETDRDYTIANSEDDCASIMAMEMSSPRKPPLSWLASTSMGDPEWTHEPKRLSNITIAGRTWYRVHGESRWSAQSPHIDTYDFGVAAKGKAVMLRPQFDTDGWCGTKPEAAERKSVASSILATVRWR